MSNQDIQIICELLLGITNINENIRNVSVNKLQELISKQFDLLLLCILEIVEKTSASTEDKQKLLKTTSLVIGRKIIEIVEYNTWKNINNDLKSKIKYKLLSLLNKEIKDNLKVCDLILELLEKIFECEGIWPEILNLLNNLFNYNPNKGDKNSQQIISLLYIIKGGINFLYNELSKNLNKFVIYLEKIFNSSNIDIKAKILAGELVYEFLSFADSSELEIIKIIIKNILISFYNSYQFFIEKKINEKDIKSFLKIFIDIESIEPSLLENYFKDIFNLIKEIISNQKFNDEKIREMGFELIISLIEDKPSIINNTNDKILISFLELILNYALEFDKNIQINFDNIYYDNFEQSFIEDEIIFSVSIMERLFENRKNENIKNYFKILVDNNIKKSWKHQYVILFLIDTYCGYNEDILFIQQFLDSIFNLSFSSENKVRFASLYCISNVISYYKLNFLKQNVLKILMIIIQLLKNEKNLRCNYEILNCLKKVIHYNTKEEINNYIDEIFDLLMKIFSEENCNVIIKKLIILNILELNEKRNNEKINILLNKIDINSLMNYFINLYNEKKDSILYGVLLEILF